MSKTRIFETVDLTTGQVLTTDHWTSEPDYRMMAKESIKLAKRFRIHLSQVTVQEVATDAFGKRL